MLRGKNSISTRQYSKQGCMLYCMASRWYAAAPTYEHAQQPPPHTTPQPTYCNITCAMTWWPGARSRLKPNECVYVQVCEGAVPLASFLPRLRMRCYQFRSLVPVHQRHVIHDLDAVVKKPTTAGSWNQSVRKCLTVKRQVCACPIATRAE